jgi:imidazolonepropionase-like amidohydrolase
MSGSLSVRDARVFDGWSAELVEGDVRIEDGVVVAVGRGVAAVDGPTIDAGGRVVVPGMIDNHFHAYGFSLDVHRLESTATSYVALRAARRLGAALRRGFTTVRDVAGGDVGLASAIAEGLLPSPRYLWTGQGLSQTGGHGDPRDPALHSCCTGRHMVEVVDGVDALRVAVRERLRTGAHAVKVMASGGVVSLADPLRVPQYSAEELRAVCDEAGRRGTYVAAHAYSPEAIVHAVGNGVRTIEHGNLLDDDSAAVMAGAGAALVPTLVTYWAMGRYGEEIGMPSVVMEKNAQVLDAGQGALERAAAAGVTVGFGTDLMGELEREQLHGLRLQHEVQGTLELLRSVTTRNATIIGDDRLGRLSPGAVGDLVVLDGDPFERPSVLWERSDGRVVVQGGVPVA